MRGDGVVYFEGDVINANHFFSRRLMDLNNWLIVTRRFQFD